MREKKEYIILTFQTTTDAMATEKTFMKAGVPGRIIPLPAQISAGCGLSWRLPWDEYEEWHDRIAELHIPCQSVHRVFM